MSISEKVSNPFFSVFLGKTKAFWICTPGRMLQIESPAILYQTQKLTLMAGHVLKCAKRVIGIPDFKYYALGDGLSNIFSRYPGKLIKYIEIDRNQLSFGFG